MTELTRSSAPANGWEPGADPFAASSSPIDLPLTYPGVWPQRSVVITDREIWEIRDADGRPLDWSGGSTTRLGACRVAVDAATMARLGLPEVALPHVVSVLEESRAMSIDARVPVLAIGSNAAPSQLRRKLHDGSSPVIIPSVLARVEGVRVAYAAFQAPRGYLPTTLATDPDASVQLAVQWLDRDLVRSLDATELPRYRRVWLDGARVPVRLQTGERLPGVYAYVAVSGALRDPDGGPWPLPGELDGAGVWSREAGLPQRELIERLLTHPEVVAEFGDSPEAFVAAGVGPERSQALFTRLGMVIGDDPLLALPDESTTVRNYGDLVPAAPRRIDGAVTGTVVRTPDRLERLGRSVVRLAPEDAERLGRPELVQIASVELEDRHPGQAPIALADVLIAADDDPAGRPAAGAVEVDHVVRMAAGVGLGEAVTLTPARLRRAKWGDRVLGRPNSVTMRVTLADPSTAERDVALVSGLTLELLGVGSGDYVVIEGICGADGVVPTVTLKAFIAPGEVVEERMRVTGGVWGARFPGARETLGVHPDIPLIFLDSAMRSRLGLAGRVLPTVRVRPARAQQFVAELREVAMILALTFIGIVVAVPIPWLGWAAAGILVLGAFAIVVARMRRRLSHVFTRRSR